MLLSKIFNVIDPLGLPTVTACSDNFFCTCCPFFCPYVHFLKSSKTKQISGRVDHLLYLSCIYILLYITYISYNISLRSMLIWLSSSSNSICKSVGSNRTREIRLEYGWTRDTNPGVRVAEGRGVKYCQMEMSAPRVRGVAAAAPRCKSGTPFSFWARASKCETCDMVRHWNIFTSKSKVQADKLRVLNLFLFCLDELDLPLWTVCAIFAIHF